jgi:hypothetical protein
MFNELGVAGSPRLPDFWAAMREASTGARYHRSFAATSWGVADRMEGHPNAFSKQTNCFSSPLARETWSVLDRRKPPRKCRLKECSPGETRYTLICLGEMAPVWTAEVNGKTVNRRLTPSQAALNSEWIDNGRGVCAHIAKMREVATNAQRLMLEETQSKAG